MIDPSNTRALHRIAAPRANTWVALGLLAGLALAFGLSAMTRTGRRLPAWDGEREHAADAEAEREA